MLPRTYSKSQTGGTLNLLRPLILLGLLAASVPIIGAPGSVGPHRAISGATPDFVLAVAPLEVLDDEPPRREPAYAPEAGVPAVVQDNSMRVGSGGPAVLAMEQRLAELKYLVGKVDGEFDNNTRHGLIAFQKVEGLGVSGVADGPTLARLAVATTPAPRYPTPGDHLELDIARQTIYVVTGGRVSAILPTSTGHNRMFTSQGWTRRAVTPNGRFRIERKINGMRRAPLGNLYKPAYFNGGIAFHGAPSVPTYPASHGCARVPMGFADWFFNEATPIGRVVYVHGGPSGQNPLPTVDTDRAPEEIPI